jgi:putative acetyltransferase
VSASALPLRDYVEADLPPLIDLWVAAWRETGFSIDFDARREWLGNHLPTLCSEGATIVVGLDAEGAPAGFVTIDAKTGALDQLCVAPSERGSGLARALLDEAKRRSPGRVELEVNEANARALRFYEREGFAAVSRGMSALSGLPTLKMRWGAKDRGSPP